MKTILILVVIALSSVVACNKSTAPATPATVSAAKVPTPVLQKLQQYAGSSATDCGQLDVHATEAQSKSASDCAMQASQGKKPFYAAPLIRGTREMRLEFHEFTANRHPRASNL